jgi:D-ribose pyranase
MKKNGILNRDINEVLGKLGHTDWICIVDCGLPIPDDIKVVDLSMELGKPSFVEVLDLIKKEMIIEKIHLAEEIKANNPTLNRELETSFRDIRYISHDMFKSIIYKSKLVIRTGEDTPYANVILQSGCVF